MSCLCQVHQADCQASICETSGHDRQFHLMISACNLSSSQTHIWPCPSCTMLQDFMAMPTRCSPQEVVIRGFTYGGLVLCLQGFRTDELAAYRVFPESQYFLLFIPGRPLLSVSHHQPSKFRVVNFNIPKAANLVFKSRYCMDYRYLTCLRKNSCA